jgi:hypothetical protein
MSYSPTLYLVAGVGKLLDTVLDSVLALHLMPEAPEMGAVEQNRNRLTFGVQGRYHWAVELK